MAENSFKNTLISLFESMDGFIDSKTVVGDAIHVGDTIILPLVDISFGVGAGAFSGKEKHNGGGGIAGKISPSCALVIQGDKVKLINIKNQDGLTKVLDLVPEILDKFSKRGEEDTPEKEEARKNLAEELKEATKSAE